MVLSEKTVKNRISNIFAKLRVNDRTQAVLRALRIGLVRLPDEYPLVIVPFHQSHYSGRMRQPHAGLYRNHRVPMGSPDFASRALLDSGGLREALRGPL